MTLPNPSRARKGVEAKNRITEPRTLSGTEKAAALLLAMGKDTAVRVLKLFEADEIKILAQAATDLGPVPKQLVDDLIEEFARSLKAGSDLHATTDHIESLLLGVVPPDRLHEIMASIRNKTDAGPIWSRLVDVPIPTVAQHFAKEHPQATALMLSRLPPAFAASVLRQFPVPLQKQIARRMLGLRQVLDTSLRILEETIAIDLLVNAGRNASVSIHSKLADIINKMDRGDSENVLAALEAHKPKDTELIRQLLFTFEDVAKLTPESLALLLDNVPQEKLAIMLYGAPPTLKEIILQTVPARSRRMIEQDLETGPRPRTKDVNKARRMLADLALEMIERGIIEVKAPEDDPDF